MRLIKRVILFFLAFMAFSVLTNCSKKDKTLKIAISHISNSPDKNNYIKWLRSFAPEAELFVMNKMSDDSMIMVFGKCHGLLLTGGEDIYPKWYGQEQDTSKCGSFSMKRDTLEFYLLKTGIKRKMPLLGVCRGHQLINVAMGGTLYVDLPSDINSNVNHRIEDWQNCYHDVQIYDNGLLGKISKIDIGEVNSNHHQAVNRLAEGLRVHAIANDGVIESIGWTDTINKPFMLGVQWHPERMDTTSALSTPIIRKFIDEATKYKERPLWKRL